MALVVKDRVKETTATTGTGTLTLDGAVVGYQSFSVIGNGNTTYYSISSSGGSEWEVGIGTYTSSGTTLARNTVLASSNSNALVPFSAGTKDVYVVYPAGKSVATEFANTFTAQQTVQNAALTVSNTGTFGGSTSLTQSGTLSALSLRGGSSPTASYNGYFNLGGYVLDSTGRNILTTTYSGGSMYFFQRRFNTAFDLSSGSSDTSTNRNAASSNTVGRAAYNGDGTVIWVHQYPNFITRYTLSTPYTLSSLSNYTNFYNFSLTWASGSQYPYWFDFIDNGTKIITLDVNWSPYRYYIWNLATAYDLTSTATVSGFISQNVSNQVASYLFADNGNKFVEIVYTGSSTTQYVRVWNLPTAYSFTGATSLSLVNNPNLFSQFIGYYWISAAHGLFKPSYGLAQYNSANNRWVANETNAATMFYSYLDNTFATLGDAAAYDYVDGSALYSVPLTSVTGTLPSTGLTGGTYTMTGLTVGGTVNFSTTGNSIAIGTSQTTGATQIGGTSQTGAITFGQSTATQTINIATGTVTSGNTKTVNIGTNGNSGSTTNITIGSGSGLVNTLIGGITRYSTLVNGTSAGTTQGTAAAILQAINTYTSIAAGSGVILPNYTGARIIVRNAGANSLNVYPPSGQTINGLAANSPLSVAVGAIIEFIQYGSLAWTTTTL